MTEKSIVIFTSMDHAKKRLRAPVQILFTLTTSDPSFSPNTYPAVAWKILNFQQPNCTLVETLTLTEDFGFSNVQQNDDGTLAPGAISAVAEPKNMVLVQDINGIIDASEQRKNLEGQKIAIYNKSGLPRRLALCAVENLNDTPNFAPVVDLGEVKHSTAIECGLPVLLQAYAVSRYKQGQILQPSDLSRPLFVDPACDPAPIDIREIKNNQAFRLYSHYTGRPVLEKV